MLKSKQSKDKQAGLVRGFTLLEITVVVAVVLTLSAIAIGQFMRMMYNIQLRSAAAEFADLTQQARMNAARSNGTYPIRFRMASGLQEIYIDLNNNSSLDANEPRIDLPKSVTAASGAPNGSYGQPTAYTLVGDTTSGTPFDNSNVLAYSPRGLPCNYTSSVCTTPASSYFVYYFQDSRGNGWSAVLVTKSGRSKVLMWNGGSWK